MQLIIADVKPKEVVTMTVDCESPLELAHLQITSRIEGEYSVIALDTALTGKKFFFRYEYGVPDLMESKNIILEFTLSDSGGNIATNAKVLEVKSVATYLTETAGHEMYSASSQKQDAYNLLSGLPLFSHLADSVYMHIADKSESSVLSRKWESPAGVKFVRFNGFDYANCTNLSIRNGFNAGTKIDFVDNLSAGDIILVGINSSDLTKKYVAVKIANIIDNSGSETDRYIFSLKK
jgi:hypothetical protein